MTATSYWQLPQENMSGYFYKNADADEMIFIHEGSGVLKTMYGNIEFGYGDYLVIPRGTNLPDQLQQQ